MSQELFGKIWEFSRKRIKFLSENSGTFYKGYQTFVDGLEDEIVEMKQEILSGKKVYLEDELGDIFWDYVCLLHSLESEGRIDSEKVFERCYQKFSERLNVDGSNNGSWSEIKQKQKIVLEQEHRNSL